jgi:thiamine transporter
MNTLLLAEVSEKTIDLVQLISICAIALLLIVLTLISVFNKKFDTKAIVNAAICISTSFALSFIKVTPVTYGGSITLASFVPILIYAYAYGFTKGLLVGLIFGILNFIQNPYILVPITFILDYLLAFASIGLMGFAPKFSKSAMKNIILGVFLVYLVKFIMHFVSGIVYFNNDAIWANLPTPNAVVYSLLYQVTYIIPDMIITLVAFILLLNTNNFNSLLSMLKKNKNAA